MLIAAAASSRSGIVDGVRGATGSHEPGSGILFA
jgi:hypothetical protein